MSKIFQTAFADIYPLYLNKAMRKNRTKEEVDQIIRWLTGYNQQQMEQHIAEKSTMEIFFEQAPQINPNSNKIKGSICKVRIEEIQDPLMKKIRYLDKLIDELAKGKSMQKILRTE